MFGSIDDVKLRSFSREREKGVVLFKGKLSVGGDDFFRQYSQLAKQKREKET